MLHGERSMMAHRSQDSVSGEKALRTWNSFTSLLASTSIGPSEVPNVVSETLTHQESLSGVPRIPLSFVREPDADLVQQLTFTIPVFAATVVPATQQKLERYSVTTQTM